MDHRPTGRHGDHDVGRLLCGRQLHRPARSYRSIDEKAALIDNRGSEGSENRDVPLKD